MHVNIEQVYRWEREKSPKPMMIQSELLLRAFVAIGQKIDNYDERVDKLATTDMLELSPCAMVFDNGWHEHEFVTE
jgi:hypothetical protein